MVISFVPRASLWQVSAVIRRAYHHTKIVFTLGPATARPDLLKKLVAAGTDVCRLNMAHASHDWTRESIRLIQAVCREEGRQIAIMMDVKGPEIRTGAVAAPVTLAAGDALEFWTSPIPEGMPPGVHRVTVNYRGLPEDVKLGDTVLVDSGLIRLEVTSTSALSVATKVIIGGELGSRRHINLPGVHVRLPSLTEKDLADIRVGIEEGVDLFALSFVRDAAAIQELRTLLKQAGSPAWIVAKLEDQAGLRNLEEIVDATDCLMVARGDLGIEIPFEQLPAVQNKVVKACLAHGKPVIIATHLLESMVENPFPTRAEITDIANAVRERADAVMLSGETTTGKYPLECVDVMKRIIEATEPLNGRELNLTMPLTTPKAKLVRSAIVLAQELGNAAIVLFTRSGHTAMVASALRPSGIPVYAFTDKLSTFRQMLILWGVEPFLIEFNGLDFEETMSRAFQSLVRGNWQIPGDRLAVVTNIVTKGRIIDVLQIRTIA
ncbi:MAG: pyruvate kinase [Verrucomicrobia bacterium]|jgi:pyruvate kinase|nr:MAG: pyruvate kinase [Verrucomicrobiota bacterium]